MIRFGNVSSDDYKANVFRIETDEAPAEEYDAVSVPGRLGELLIDKKTRKNVEMRYRVVFLEDARKNSDDMKNALQALVGYQRLEDSDYPDEYFMARISKAITPKYTQDRDKVKFELTLSRKPQRCLKSGETTYSPLTGVVTGNPVYVDGSFISAPNVEFHIDLPYKGKGPVDASDYEFEYSDGLSLYVNGQSVFSMTGLGKLIKADLTLKSGGTIDRVLGELPTSGWTKVSGFGSRYSIDFDGLSEPFQSAADVLGCSFSSVIDPDAAEYRKTVGTCWFDQNSHVLTVVAPANLTTLSDFHAWLAAKPVKPQVVFDYVSGITWNRPDPVFPNTWVELSTDAGTLSVDIEGSNILKNPTLFPSKPLIRIYGNGTATINGETITVENSVSYVDIDCEIMDCYEGTINRNNDVTFSTYDFPELLPGDNVFLASGGISGFLVTPRWWKL